MALPLARRVGRGVAHRLFAPPRRPHHRTPAELGMDFTEAATLTEDDVELHLWLVAPTGRLAGTAIVGHGIGLTKSASLRQARILHDAGYAVVMYDHRNHGRSAADEVQRGMAERFTRDITAAARFAQRTYDAQRPVVALGFSFSSFPSVYALRDSDAIGAVVCDSGPAVDIGALFSRFAAAGALPIPSWVLTNPWGRQMLDAAVTTATELLDGHWPPPPDVGGLGTTPMLFITGTDDPIVPPAEGRAMAARYPGAGTVELPGRHLDTAKVAPDAYREALLSFLRSTTLTR